MSEYVDPIIDAIFGDAAFEEEAARTFDAEYGKGKWTGAVLIEASGQEKDGRRFITLNVNLEGDKRPFTFSVDAPTKPQANGEEPDEKAVQRHQISLNRLKTLVHATGTWVTFNDKGKPERNRWPQGFDDFSDDAQFERLTSLFQSLVGKTMPINVKYRTYTKRDGSEGSARDVWGLEPRRGV